jgi:hypothetical protein
MPKFCPGGNGGAGGDADGAEGPGGAGAAGMSGTPGVKTFEVAGNGGDAGNGFLAGTRGAAGTNNTTPPGANPLGNFVPGAMGVNCIPSGALQMTFQSAIDPEEHNQFVKFCSVPTVTMFGGGTTMGMSFPAASPQPAMSAFSVSGAIGPLPRTFSGTATFSGSIPVKVTIVSINTDGSVTITVEFGGPGSPPGHPLLIPIIYTKRIALPAACPVQTMAPASAMQRIGGVFSKVASLVLGALSRPAHAVVPTPPPQTHETDPVLLRAARRRAAAG